jgi:DNA-binding GntR family transcriptional regulator
MARSRASRATPSAPIALPRALAQPAQRGLWATPYSDPIAQAIARAVSDGRVPPGAKLGEDQLSRIFGVSRTLVRQALRQLGFTGVVTLLPNRGAFVASPSQDDIEHAYAARRLVETEIVRDAARHCTAADIRGLRAHVARQRAAEARRDRGETIRLLGEFHLLIAAIAGNPVLAGFVAQLLPRTSLMIALYDDRAVASCAVREHVALIEALAAGDAASCMRLMRGHLTTNEQRLEIAAAPAIEVDLDAALRDYSG